MDLQKGGVIVSFTKGDKIAYSSAFAGRILGDVVRVGREPLHGDYVDMRVTSRKSRTYPFGHVARFSASSPWLYKR